MIPDGEHTAVVDRIEEANAILEVNADGDLYELVVAEERLPATGRHGDAVFEVMIQDGDVVTATYNSEATTERQNTSQERFDRLSDRPPHTDEGDSE